MKNINDLRKHILKIKNMVEVQHLKILFIKLNKKLTKDNDSIRSKLVMKLKYQ